MRLLNYYKREWVIFTTFKNFEKIFYYTNIENRIRMQPAIPDMNKYDNFNFFPIIIHIKQLITITEYRTHG